MSLRRAGRGSSAKGGQPRKAPESLVPLPACLSSAVLPLAALGLHSAPSTVLVRMALPHSIF